MSEEAVAAEVDSSVEESAEAVVEETPHFELFTPDPEETPDAVESEPEPISEPSGDAEKKPRGDWSARVRKDRQQRKKEIDLKRKEHELSSREQQIRSGMSLDDVKRAVLESPEQFLRKAGIDPHEFYSDWTNRIVSGSDQPSQEAKSSALEREVQELKSRLSEREALEQKALKAQENDGILRDFHGKIDEFRASTDKYPLTSTQCSAQDIAEGMATYWQKTGVELTFEDAFEMIESGLVAEESKLLENPRLVQRFKSQYNLAEDAPKSIPGKTASKTLSSKMAVAPTKQAPEEMTHDEIIRHWSGKIYT